MRGRMVERMLRIWLVIATLSLGLGACGGDADAPKAPGAADETPRAEAAIVTADDPPAPGSDEQAATAAAPPVVDCAAHVEPSVKRFNRRRDVIREPFALVTVARDMPRLSRASYRPRAGRLAGVKLPIGLRAGHSATLRVSAVHREHAALLYRDQTRLANRVEDGDEAVNFKPCQADTPAFSGGTVGPITGWAGALIVTGPRCIRLELRVDGERRPDIRLPLGRRCR